jgi:lambda family phage tail tape measure protein
VAQSNVRLTVDGRQPLQVIGKIRQAVAGLDAGYKKLQTSVNQAASATKRFAVDLEKQTRTLREQTRGVQGLVAAYAGFRTLKGAITAGVELETAQKRAELLTQRFGQLAGIQQVAAQSADKFRIAQTDTLAALIDLGNRLGPQGASLAEISDVYEGFNTILAINKVSTQEAASAQLQLNQALGSGVLQGEEYRAINEATPQVIDAVAKILGVARGEVKKLASEGAVSAPVLIQALRDIKDQGADELEKSFESTSGRLREFQKAQTELAQAIGTQLLPAFTPLLTTVTSAIKEFAALPKPVKNFTAAVLGITAALVALGPILTTTIGLLKAVGAATLIAAGPWVALAAGITAATLALASYESQAQKTAKAAAAGDAQALHSARSRLQAVQQNLSLEKLALEEASKSEERGIKARIKRLREDESTLKKGITVGAKAEAGVLDTGGLATAPGAPKEDKAAKKATDQLARLSNQVNDYLFAAKNRLAIEKQQNDIDRVRTEADVQRLEISRKYAELTKGVADATVLNNAAAAKSIELQLVDIQLGKELGVVLDAQAAKLKEQAQLAGDAAIKMQQFAAVKNPIDDLGKSIGVTTSEFSSLVSEVARGTATIGDAFQRLANSIIDNLIQIAVQQAVSGLIGLVSSVFNPFASVSKGLSGSGALGGSVSGLGIGGSAAGASYAGATGLTGIGGSVAGSSFGGFQGAFANGGSVMSGKPALVGERGPELFVPGRSGSIIPNNAMGGTNIVVNVSSQGGVSSDGEGADNRRLGEAIGVAVRQELIRQKRPGGLLS